VKQTKQNVKEYILQDGNRLRAGFRFGDMVHFWYNPKHKITLPYYDRFPLIFPIEIYKDGFLGINFHYLPLKYRAMLMDALLNNSRASNNKFDKKTKMIISYTLLNRAAQYKVFKPCVKKYLSNHIQSKFIRIEPEEWKIAIFLPSASWQKASQNKVWEDSLLRIQ
jgi:hypothetical protein